MLFRNINLVQRDRVQLLGEYQTKHFKSSCSVMQIQDQVNKEVVNVDLKRVVQPLDERDQVFSLLRVIELIEQFKLVIVSELDFQGNQVISDQEKSTVMRSVFENHMLFNDHVVESGEHFEDTQTFQLIYQRQGLLRARS